MPEKRLVMAVRLSEFWQKQAPPQELAALVNFLYSHYLFLHLADPTAELDAELAVGKDEAPWLMIYEAIEGGGEMEPGNGFEEPSQQEGGFQGKKDRAGVPTITEDDLNPEILGEDNA